MDIQQFEERKRDHIRHALNPAHQASGLTGLDRIHLIHEALPELDFEEIRLNSVCLGKPALKPFYISGMTAGHSQAAEVNRTLALACQSKGWSMGVGSQRRELESQDNSIVDHWRDLRKAVPHLVLFANIGISQLKVASIAQIRRLVDSIEAQALVVHTNVLQEVLQPEGTPRFRGALLALQKLCSELGAPVVLKETGCGFSPSTLGRLSETGLRAIDVSGLGGTHWGRIEGARSKSGSIQSETANTFADWGEPTFEVVRSAQELLPSLELWASGGVRSGLDAAKLIALGAHRVGFAQPALEAALQGQEALEHWMERIEFELKVALFCTGCETPTLLWKKEGVWTFRRT